MEELSELRRFVQRTPVCLLLVGEDGVIVEANAEAERLFGWSLGELVGASVEILLPGPVRQVHAGHRRRFALAPTSRTMGSGSRLEARHRDGQLFPVDVMLAPIGGRGEVLAVVVDRSELRRAEEALRRAQATLEQIMSGVPDIVYVVRTDRDPLRGRVEMVSERVRDVVGYAAHEFQEDAGLWFRNVHPDDVAELAESTRALHTERKPVHRVYRLRHKDTGEWRIMEDRSSPLLDDHGDVVGSCGAARDITEQRQLETNLVVAERLAALGTLSASVAHELGNPLTAVIAGLDQALRSHATGVESERVEQLLRDALDGASRMRAILRDFTGLARAEEEEPELVDPRHCMELALRLAAGAVGERADVVKDYAEIPLIRADETRLAQVFLNLLLNSAQAIPESRRGVIRVATARGEPGRVEVVVEDDGAGIGAEDAAKVFDPFFTTKPRGRGTGLGLFVSRRIVRELGGEISLSPREGGGTRARVVLPARD